MQAQKEIPSNYEESYTLDLSKNKALVWFINLGSLGMLFVFGVWFARQSMIIRPELWEAQNQSLIAGVEIISLVIALALMTVFHELVHALFFWLLSGNLPIFQFKGLYAFSAAPEWYFKRWPYFIIMVAPLLIFTIIGLKLMSILPLIYLPGLIFFLTFNGAGSTSDILSATITMYQPKDSFFKDFGHRLVIFNQPIEK